MKFDKNLRTFEQLLKLFMVKSNLVTCIDRNQKLAFKLII